MAAQRQASVLQRKTRAAREGNDPRVMSPVKALRLTLARAADTLLGLSLTVATVEQRRIEAGEIETELGTWGLYMLLDGADGARAALRFDPALMAGLIEVQTIGQVLPGPVPTRAATRTDAAMVAPLVDLMLAGYDTEMATGPAGYGPRGFRFGDRVEDARALALLLPAPEFDLFRLTVDLGPGVRTGRLDLLLPPAPPTPSTRPGDPPHAAPSRTEGPDLAAATLSAPVALQVMLARVTLSLRAAMALAPGTRLSLPKDSIGTAQLVGTGGHVLAEGRLGQRDGWRALRLLGPTAEGAPSVAPPAPPLPEPDPARVPAIASGTD